METSSLNEKINLEPYSFIEVKDSRKKRIGIQQDIKWEFKVKMFLKNVGDGKYAVLTALGSYLLLNTKRYKSKAL